MSSQQSETPRQNAYLAALPEHYYTPRAFGIGHFAGDLDASSFGIGLVRRQWQSLIESDTCVLGISHSQDFQEEHLSISKIAASGAGCATRRPTANFGRSGHLRSEIGTYTL